jgi:hypothetical protein
MPKPSDEENDPRIDQALRLAELRKAVMDKVKGPWLEGGTEGLPMDLQTQFWENVLAFESAEETTFLDRLRDEAGFVPRPAGEIGEGEAMKEALWSLLEALASIRVFLFYTDHLDDGELYRVLMTEVLPDSTTDLPADTGWNCRIDVCDHGGPGDPDGTATWLRYYADDAERDAWDGELPPKEKPRHDRDRFLPVPPEERDMGRQE